MIIFHLAYVILVCIMMSSSFHFLHVELVKKKNEYDVLFLCLFHGCHFVLGNYKLAVGAVKVEGS